MKPLTILGNWKANKTPEEAESWLGQFFQSLGQIPDTIKIILCPAYIHLSLFSGKKLPIFLGTQDISAFESGSYTGEVTASMLDGQVRYALIGHSERRINFGETDKVVAQKIKQALGAGIIPVVCVSQDIQAQKMVSLAPDFGGQGLLLYEPLFAVGSGKPETPENANLAAQDLIKIAKDVKVLYGGSVTPENVKSYLDQPNLSGVGVGGASLDPIRFAALIKAAAS